MVGLAPSDRIRVLAVAAGALSARGKRAAARKYFLEAAGLAGGSIARADPAHRDLAVAANNLACALEEASARSGEDAELMLLAARTARLEWELAGTWVEVMRAEYRLAMSHLHAGENEPALRHAEISLEIAAARDASTVDRFFGQEAYALAAKASGDTEGFAKAVELAGSLFGRLTEEEKSWCGETLAKLRRP